MGEGEGSFPPKLSNPPPNVGLFYYQNVRKLIMLPHYVAHGRGGGKSTFPFALIAVRSPNYVDERLPQIPR